MEFKDLVTILAIVVGPIAAVQLEKILDSWRQAKARRMQIFSLLMTTRTRRLSQEHVDALNQIELEFRDKKYESVLAKWREYVDHLVSGDSSTPAWETTTHDLFIQLLSEMGERLGYNIDQVSLRRYGYRPIAIATVEDLQLKVLNGLADVLSENKPVKVIVDKTGTIKV